MSISMKKRGFRGKTAYQGIQRYGETVQDYDSSAYNNVSSVYAWWGDGRYNATGDYDSREPHLVLVTGHGSFQYDSRLLGVRLIHRTSNYGFSYGQMTYRLMKSGTTSTWGVQFNNSNYYNAWMNGAGSSYAGNASPSNGDGESFHFRIWIKNDRRGRTSTQAASDVVGWSQMVSKNTSGTIQMNTCTFRTRGMSDGDQIVNGLQVYPNSGNFASIKVQQTNLGTPELA